jgi:hypothetical protein
MEDKAFEKNCEETIGNEEKVLIIKNGGKSV